jgi:hypothetical protein
MNKLVEKTLEASMEEEISPSHVETDLDTSLVEGPSKNLNQLKV